MILLLPEGYLEMGLVVTCLGKLLAFGKAYQGFWFYFKTTIFWYMRGPACRSLSAVRHSLSLGVCIADLDGGTALHKSVFSVLTKRKWVRIRKFAPSPLRKDGLATPQIRMQGILFGVTVIPHLSPDSHLTKLALR